MFSRYYEDYLIDKKTGESNLTQIFITVSKWKNPAANYLDSVVITYTHTHTHTHCTCECVQSCMWCLCVCIVHAFMHVYMSVWGEGERESRHRCMVYLYACSQLELRVYQGATDIYSGYCITSSEVLIIEMSDLQQWWLKMNLLRIPPAACAMGVDFYQNNDYTVTPLLQPPLKSRDSLKRWIVFNQGFLLHGCMKERFEKKKKGMKEGGLTARIQLIMNETRSFCRKQHPL